MIGQETEAINILVVDDRPQNLAAVEVALSRPGLRLLMAQSATDALELMLVHEVALALINVRMPEMDGFELAELMRGVERSRNVPIIFMTAESHDPNRTFKGYEAGAVDFLHKPFEPRILRSKVEVFAELFSQRRTLSEQLAQLKSSLRLNEMFTAVLGHDLRNPLNAISLSTEVLIRQSSDPAISGVGQRLRGSVKRMATMIEQLLDVARIRSGGLALRPKEEDVARVLNTTADELVNPAQPERLAVTACGDTVAVFDADRLSQVFSNLISNALQHGDPASPVAVSVEGESSATIVIRIRNRGTIPMERLPVIFEPFKTAGSPSGGLGLGLYIAKKLVEAHGGSLTAEIDVAGHTTFCVSLPRDASLQEPRSNVLL